MIKSLPNIISILRLLGIPVLLWILLSAPEENGWTAAIFFLVLALTDLLDGYLARKLHAVTALGALLDPLVDKLLILSPLTVMIGIRSSLNGEPWVPGWMVVLLLAREIWITGVRGFAATEGVIISAGDVGKYKTVFQVLGVFFLLLHGERILLIGNDWITGQYIGLQCLLTSLILSYWSGVEYTWKFFRGIMKKRPEQKVPSLSSPECPRKPALRLQLRATER